MVQNDTSSFQVVSTGWLGDLRVNAIEWLRIDKKVEGELGLLVDDTSYYLPYLDCREGRLMFDLQIEA